LRRPRALAARRQKSVFFKGILRRNVALRMKRTRHQLAPAMAVEKIIDGAVAGWMADRLLIGALEVVDVQHLSGPGGRGEARQQRAFRRDRHVLALASAARLRFERFDPTVVVGHVGAIHRTQRNPHRLRNRRLRHVALTQQNHAYALALQVRYFPMQRRF
jgi:hypothetical protein